MAFARIRKSYLYVIVCIAVLGFCLHAKSDDAPRPIYAKKSQLRVEWIKRIWCNGPHNAFPDLEFFRGKWYVATREGTTHGISGFGRVRIIASDDGDNWKSVAMFDDFGDYRRAELSVTPDDRLMVLSKLNIYDKPNANHKRTFKARDYENNERTVFAKGVENRVAFSKDGVNWSPMKSVRGTHPRAWFYSGVQWYKGIGYAIDRQGRKLYHTKNGLDFEKVSDVPVGNESRISFAEDGTMHVFFRNGSMAKSSPPYTKWTLNRKNKKGPHSYGGPGIIVLPNGDVWTASRHRIDEKAFDFPAGENVFPDGTVLFKLQGDTLIPKLLIRGGGDRGYNGMIWREKHLWLAYNAPSRKADKSCIYFAKIKLK